jgi:hypothetical protein
VVLLKILRVCQPVSNIKKQEKSKMRKVSFLLLSIIGVILLSGCTPAPQLTPLQIQAMQTQTFETTQKKAFTAVMTVLQDKGYTIKSTDAESGFITAESSTLDSNDIKIFGLSFEQDNHKDQTASVTASVRKITQNKKEAAVVRLGIVSHYNTSNKGGKTYTKSNQVLDPQAYQAFFADIRQQIFVGDAIN